MRQTLGEFRVEELIGRGGMGHVYRGYQASLDRPVAIKVLSDTLTKDDTVVARFQREARAAASLVHPNVIQIFSIGEDGEIHFFAMEYVRGKDLAEHLAAGRVFSLAETIEILVQVAEALCAAAEVGLIHRDIKPSNIMLTDRGAVKITDFGLAKTGESNLTDAGMIVGTANYMSPEQGQGRDLDFRTDIYSLGAVFYELVAGRPPFIADQPAAVLYKHVYEDPLPPSRISPETPEAVDEVILRMLAKRPEDRYDSPESLLEDLLSLRRRLGDDAAVSGRGSSVEQAALTEAIPPPSDAGAKPLQPASGTSQASAVVPAQRCALVADDVASVRRLVGTVLQDRGFQVIEAEDGQSAVKQTLENRPGLIVLDVGLPRLDGLGVLDRLAAEGVHSKIIIISAQADREQVAESSACEIHGYLAKPFNIHELRRRVDEVMRTAAEENDAAVQDLERTGLSQAAAGAEPSNRFILVCEPKSYTQGLFRRVLEGAGHRVACIGDSTEALTLLEEELPDLLVVSFASDQPQSSAILETVRKRGWGVPVITVVDELDVEGRTYAEKTRLGPVLLKPMRLDELRSQVTRALEQSDQAPKEAMRSPVFTGILNRQRIRDNAFNVFDFARSLVPLVPKANRQEYEENIQEYAARNVCGLIGGVIAHHAAQKGAAEAMRFVRAAYRKGNFEVRNLCLALLREILPEEEEAQILMKIVTDEDFRIRIRVLHRMGELGRPEFAPLAVRFLNDDVWKVRNAAVECVEMLGLKVVLQPLLQFYRNAASAVPERLRTLVAQSRDPEVFRTLQEAARRGETADRAFAAELMGLIAGRQTTGPLVELLRDKQPAVRAAAARALGPTDNRKVFQALTDVLTDANASVQAAAVEALRRQTLTPPARYLLELLAARGKRIHPAAARLLTQINQRSEALERMLYDLDRLDSDTRKVLSLLLSHLYPQEETLQEVVRKLNASDRNLRRQTAREVAGALPA
jgi:DNA-binding response OmpR family regulator/HEAT repeat protein/predicted Ser/Thr protein kinase